MLACSGHVMVTQGAIFLVSQQDQQWAATGLIHDMPGPGALSLPFMMGISFSKGCRDGSRHAVHV